MVRTKETAATKVGHKAPRKGLAGPSTSDGDGGSSSKTSKNRESGNPVCPRETPVWQKPITDFFKRTEDRNIDDSNKTDLKDLNDVEGASCIADNIHVEKDTNPKDKDESTKENVMIKH